MIPQGNKKHVAHKEHEKLLVDTVDNIFGVLQTLYAATSQLLIMGSIRTPSRFFFSDNEMCQPLLKSIDERFVQSQAKVLSACLDNRLAYISVTPKPTCSETVMSFGNGQLEFVYPPRPTLFSFGSFVPETALYSPRLFLNAGKTLNNIARVRCVDDMLDGMKTLFDIFCTDSVENIRIEILNDYPKMKDTIMIKNGETNAIRSAVENLVFGIKDFLHSKSYKTTFVPESCRDSLQYLFTNRDIARDTSRQNESFTAPLVTSLIYIPQHVYATYPSPINNSDRNLSIKETDIIAMLTPLLAMKPALAVGVGSLWKGIAYVVDTIARFDVNRLRKEYEVSLLMLKNAATYYEFASAIRNLSPVEMLLAAV